MTIGFNKRPEVIRELKLAFGTPIKKFFAKSSDLEKADLVITIDEKQVDLANFENIFFNNETDLLRKVISALLGQTAKTKEPLFMSEAKRLIASEGLELKKASNTLVEIVIGATNDNEKWLPANNQNRFLVSQFPRYVEIEVRRDFFEAKPNKDLFYKVQTNGLFHIIVPLYVDERNPNLMYFDTIFKQVMAPFLFAVRLMKFHGIVSQQSFLILLKNVGGKNVCFNTWSGYPFSFTTNAPEIPFLFTFSSQDEWIKITDVLLNFYRELCTETSCLDITDLIIRKRVRDNLRDMREFGTSYSSEGFQLPRIDISSFGLDKLETE